MNFVINIVPLENLLITFPHTSIRIYMITLKSNNFDKYINSIPKVLVMFASPTCLKCKQALKEIDFEELRDEGLELLYIDGNKWDEISDRFEIEYFPTFICFINGKQVYRHTPE